MIAGIQDKVGTIKKDLLADMILVGGKPDQDISNLYHRPDLVIKKGKIIIIFFKYRKTCGTM